MERRVLHVPLVLHVQVEHLLTTQIATKVSVHVVLVNGLLQVHQAVQTSMLVVMVQVQVQHVRQNVRKDNGVPLVQHRALTALLVDMAPRLNRLRQHVLGNVQLVTTALLVQHLQHKTTVQQTHTVRQALAAQQRAVVV